MTVATRDRLLDAAERVLLEQGLTGLTLDAVAATAGTSKGGLLYHFRTKDALVVGLVERLGAVFEAELEQAASRGRSIVDVSLCVPDLGDEEQTLVRALLAVLRSSDSVEALQPAVQRLFGRWQELLTEELGDPVLAETVRLVGDGLYLGALVGARPPSADRIAEVRALLLGDRDGRARGS
jgi:AcrR family transcriptional regulator